MKQPPHALAWKILTAMRLGTPIDIASDTDIGFWQEDERPVFVVSIGGEQVGMASGRAMFIILKRAAKAGLHEAQFRVYAELAAAIAGVRRTQAKPGVVETSR